MALDPKLIDAARWHAKHSAAWAGHAAQAGLKLARAERWLQSMIAAERLAIVWKDDPDDVDLSFVETWEPDEQKKFREQAHTYACACIRALDDNGRPGEVLAGLGGIADADRDYRRTIEADLAVEAMHVLEREAAAELERARLVERAQAAARVTNRDPNPRGVGEISVYDDAQVRKVDGKVQVTAWVTMEDA